MAQEPDIDVGAITEALNNKTDTDGENIASTFPQGILQAGGVDTVVDFQSPSSANGYTWYRKYASGWVEQGGFITGWNARDNVGLITLPVTMADTNYCVLTTGTSNRGAATDWNFSSGATPKSTTQFSYSIYGSGVSDIATGMSWQVSGMSAQ